MLTGQAGMVQGKDMWCQLTGHSEMTGWHVVRFPMGRGPHGAVLHMGWGSQVLGKVPLVAALMVEGPVVGTSMAEVSGGRSVLGHVTGDDGPRVASTSP